jgi:hypothetical protein
LLALEKGLCVFEQSHIVAGYDFDKVFSGGQLAEGYAEVVGVVKGIE